MSTPHILKPMKYLRHRAKVSEDATTRFDMRRARLAADRGDGAAVQRIARAALAKDSR